MASEPSIDAITGRPFNEQVAFFRRKLGTLVPTARWDDIQRGAHDQGFMVAGAAKADLLSDLAAAVDRAVTEGRGLSDFRRDFRGIVERHGWHGWTGESSRAGRNWRTRVIYKTNAQTSYSAGRLAQLQESGFAYWIYRHGGSRDPRPQHLSWDGLTLSPDHPFWRTHYPPNGWGCSCYVVGAHRQSSAKRMGGDPGKALPDGWDDIDAKTDAPSGIDTGWDYQPGARVSKTVATMAEKIRHWEYQIAKGYMGEVPASVRDQLATSYRGLPSVGDDARRYAQRVLRDDNDSLPPVRTLGLLTERDAAQASEIVERDVGMFDYAVDAPSVRHVQRQHGSASERDRGQRPVTAEDYALLPQLLNDGDAFEASGRSRAGNPLIRRQLVVAGETYIAVWEVRNGRRQLMLQTFYIRTGS